MRPMTCLHWQRPRQRPIKIACTELFGSVYTAQRQRPMQISLGFCTLVIGICIGHGLGQCKIMKFF